MGSTQPVCVWTWTWGWAGSESVESIYLYRRALVGARRVGCQVSYWSGDHDEVEGGSGLHQIGL